MKKSMLLLLALSLGTVAPAVAQESKQADKPAAPKEEAPAQAEPATAAQAAGEERPVSGTIDFGYRWVGDVGGDFNTYRSVVNLGEGPKLFGVDLSFKPVHSIGLFDRLDVRASSWGGDPYNTARIDARKNGLYNLRFDYRNLAYFNFLPSFGNPQSEQGVVSTQRAFDTFRRSSDFEFELFPGARIVPFAGYQRYGGRGRGISNFVAQGNEYDLPTRFSDHADNYRGGVRIEMNRFHITLEQGAIHYRDAQEVFSQDPNPNFGNIQNPILGQRLFLGSGREAYGVRGDSIYTRAAFTANPVSWADIYAQFLYSRPNTEVHYEQSSNGNFVSFALRTVYQGQLLLADSRARQPHPSGSFSLEIRPIRRVRIVQAFMTDRLHTAASASLVDRLISGGTGLAPVNTFDADRLVMNYNQNENQLLVDVLPGLTLRGGFRHAWGDAEVPPGLIATTQGLERQVGELNQSVGLAGASFRMRDRVSANFDFEGSSPDKSYFRTSLHDYRKMRAQARLTPIKSLQLTARFTALSNKNNQGGSDYDFLSRDNSLSAYWTPFDGKHVSVLADYSRYTMRSDINWLDPLSFDPELSRYRERAHTGTLLVDLGTPAIRTGQPKISVGGTFYRGTGTRPSRYYQPQARVSVPLHRNVYFNAEWRWYGLTQPTYIFEGFRSHHFMTGLRLTM